MPVQLVEASPHRCKFLRRGSTAYYRAAWNIGIVEWRILMTLNSIQSLNVSELSDAADVDKAAASRSLVLGID